MDELPKFPEEHNGSDSGSGLFAWFDSLLPSQQFITDAAMPSVVDFGWKDP